MSQTEDLVERVERLLLRHDELLRTNTLLRQQITDLEQEREQLQLRLNAARTRIDTLIARLPTPEETAAFLANAALPKADATEHQDGGQA